jgi:hypothetical protein
MNRRSFLFAGASALFLPGVGPAAPLRISPSGLIFLEVTVNGRAAKALIDTGSVRGVQLSAAFAASAGLALAQTGQTTTRYQGGPRALLAARLATLVVADSHFADIEAFVSPGDIESIAEQIGETFDAILGWPILSRGPFAIDYAAGTFATGSAEGGAALALPLEQGRRLPVTAGKLAGTPITFLIDTGAPWCNVDLTLAGGAAANSRIELPFEIGGRPFTTTFRVRDLGAMTHGTGARAVIGHRFLSRFRLLWNPAAPELRLAG